jgi:hypothetical protein
MIVTKKSDIDEKLRKESTKSEEIKKLRDIPDTSSEKHKENTKLKESKTDSSNNEFLEKRGLDQRKEVLRLKEIPDYPEEAKKLGDMSPKDEKIAEDTMLKGLDKNVLEKIEKRYRKYIAREKLDEASKNPTRFEGHKEYVEGFRKTYPESPPEMEVIADVRDGNAYVDKDHFEVPTTVAHERIHQLCNEKIDRELGGNLREGFTEHYARKIHEPIELNDIPESYPRERKITEMIESRVGEDALSKAYFGGDIDTLRTEIDSQLGEGTLDKISALTEEGKYDEVEHLIRGNK